jgi:hypothetical protein
MGIGDPYACGSKLYTSFNHQQPHGQIESLPHQDAKHGAVDHGRRSNNVFLRLRGKLHIVPILYWEATIFP